jgi:cubilin
LTNPTEYISSIGYPSGNYSNNEECIWVIQNQNVTGSTIMLQFVDFSLESHPNCHYDFIEVREGEICTQAAARVVVPVIVW